MIGQKNLRKRLNSFTLNTLPHSILLVGEEGAGHEEVCRELASNLNVEFIINPDSLSEIIMHPITFICYIDLAQLTEKDMNELLKMYEEPFSNAYIILGTTSKECVLDTILTRSYILEMDRFTQDELLPLIEKDISLTLSICSTPGQIEKANHTDMNGLHDMCEKIVTSLKHVSYANALKIADRINFKDETDKYDLFLFTKMLGNVLLENKCIDIYMSLLEMTKTMPLILDKKRYLQHYISQWFTLARK